MKKSVQAGKYIVSDFIASSVVWLLFNLIRYEEVAVYEGFDTVGAFLLHIPSLKGQLLIPFFWFVLYWFSGYYNKPFGKSRLTELFLSLIHISIRGGTKSHGEGFLLITSPASGLLIIFL